MPIDSKTKKLSLLNLNLPWVTTLPEPTGDLDEGDKLHLLNMYSGLAATAAAEVDLSPNKAYWYIKT